MAHVTVKINLKFSLKDSENNTSLYDNYKSENDYMLAMTARSADNNDINLAFEVSKDNVVAGNFTHELKDSSLEITCQGTFKINVKSDYVSDVIDKNALWLFDCIGSYDQGLTRLKVKDGLKEEEYEYRRRGEAVKGIRYPIDVIADNSV